MCPSAVEGILSQSDGCLALHYRRHHFTLPYRNYKRMSTIVRNTRTSWIPVSIEGQVCVYYIHKTQDFTSKWIISSIEQRDGEGSTVKVLTRKQQNNIGSSLGIILARSLDTRNQSQRTRSGLKMNIGVSRQKGSTSFCLMNSSTGMWDNCLAKSSWVA